ncbi:MAG: protein phosphatase [Zetaproteobacteria bacterium CG12_big_fil_rev_8_21_14_0_65_54_13]|nr:MAG: protein phosphatase [Zetaproteobacteria bacterium CG23_combo_of_CG06-09_8_20_14_all_54_7]PIW44470.1 MAG: protein phosphatase [Zetaproteobacteria bacterium CG12_big_fil_rev_8_21_14_0_65_54_13]PIX55625.1 MAG: protein phosphatase [Zetaproteobacteria bacterium CG_4_10_14_3_um_filter_54_28]PJA27751.1 MAG: protein phosphatase [Zetaproteobacteria bacterium CG_4_9_14_3_um_filter_54_145]
MTSLEMHAATDVGKRRKHNEDCVKITPTHGIAVLADGMGGYSAGEVASAMAVDIITDRLQQQILTIPTAAIDSATGFTGESILVREAIRHSNDAIYQEAKTNAGCAGMGTTVLAAVFYADRITAAHVGDSRMYRLRDNRLSHVTEDHSLIHEQVRRGLVTAADARNSSIKNLVTRALGIEQGVDPDIVEDTVLPGDMYLMCSDGLTDVVADEVIQQTMTRHRNNLEKSAEQLIHLANEAGGPDNISVILISAKAAPKRGFFSRLLGK